MLLSRLKHPLLALALVSLNSACDPKAKAQAPAASAATQAASAAPTATALPRVDIKLDRPVVSALSEDHWAQVEGEPGWTYEWSLEGGHLMSGLTTNAIRFTAGDPGAVVLRCRIRDAAGSESLATREQTVVALPSIDGFEAFPPIITQGEAASLRWEARDMASLTLDPDQQDVLKVAILRVQPVKTSTYTLTAANLAGETVEKTLTLKVVPQPVIKAFGAEGTPKVSQPMTLKAEFAEGRAEIRQGATVLATATESPLRLQVTPGATTVYTLVVTNEAKATTTMSLTATVPTK